MLQVYKKEPSYRVGMREKCHGHNDDGDDGSGGCDDDGDGGGDGGGGGGGNVGVGNMKVVLQMVMALMVLDLVLHKVVELMSTVNMMTAEFALHYQK